MSRYGYNPAVVSGFDVFGRRGPLGPNGPLGSYGPLGPYGLFGGRAHRRAMRRAYRHANRWPRRRRRFSRLPLVLLGVLILAVVAAIQSRQGEHRSQWW